ncbi:hypothetical protein XENTR_v10000992 [Xenopus tropicalis]|uniref:Uncharacterized protein LOC100488166 n=1 Tax=Xenopus tropicalis TaxID=8364 RepID=A0A8J0QQ06_XENTR|nr:uncharacterized protein LOC100488166 [Xenopus tropicalis]KAE8630861.1 hypothetical protein XENTR_v10000992 [Xenopus tropicalis]
MNRKDKTYQKYSQMKKTLVWLCFITQAYSFPTNPVNTEDEKPCCDDRPQLIYKGYDTKHGLNIFVFKFLPWKQEPTTEKEGGIGGEGQTDIGLDHTTDIMEEDTRETQISTIFPQTKATEDTSESPKLILDTSSQDKDVTPEHGDSTALLVTEPTLKNTHDEQATIKHEKNILIENDFQSEDFITEIDDREIQISTIFPQTVTTEETNTFPKVIFDISSQEKDVPPEHGYSTALLVTEPTLKTTHDEQASLPHEKHIVIDNVGFVTDFTSEYYITRVEDRETQISTIIPQTVTTEGTNKFPKEVIYDISSQDQVATQEYSYTAESDVTEAAAGETKSDKGVNYHLETGISSKDQGVSISTFGDTVGYHGTEIPPKIQRQQETNTDSTKLTINKEKGAPGFIREDSGYIQIPHNHTYYSTGEKNSLYPSEGNTQNFTDCIKYGHLCKNLKPTKKLSLNLEGDCHTSLLGCGQKGNRQKNKKGNNPKANPGHKATVLGKDGTGKNHDMVKEKDNKRIHNIFRTIIFGKRQRQQKLKCRGLHQNSKNSHSSESSSESNSDSRQICS